MSANAIEQPTLTLREGMERIFATFNAMSEEDRADVFLYLKHPRQYVDVARRAQAQAYPARPRLAVVK